MTRQYFYPLHRRVHPRVIRRYNLETDKLLCGTLPPLQAPHYRRGLPCRSAFHCTLVRHKRRRDLPF